MLALFLTLTHAYITEYNDNGFHHHTPERETAPGHLVWGFDSFPEPLISECNGGFGSINGDYQNGGKAMRLEMCDTHFIFIASGIIHDFGADQHCEDVSYQCYDRRVRSFSTDCIRVSVDLEFSGECADLTTPAQIGDPSNPVIVDALVKWCPLKDSTGKVTGVSRAQFINGQRIKYKEFSKVGDVGYHNDNQRTAPKLAQAEESQQSAPTPPPPSAKQKRAMALQKIHQMVKMGMALEAILAILSINGVPVTAEMQQQLRMVIAANAAQNNMNKDTQANRLAQPNAGPSTLVNVFAAVGLVYLLYGAFRHYVKSE
jgi:hypothetical protein